MSVAVTVTATITGHRRRGVREHALTLAPGEVPARDLIAAAVAGEIAAQAARAEENSFVRVLTASGLASALANGVVRMGDPEISASSAPDVAAATEAALLAFDDGIFKVFVGGREVPPGSPAWIEEGASLMFVRLVPLTGRPADRADGPVTVPVRQPRRARDVLQDAMTAQDTFTAAGLEALARDPALAPVLGRLVWVSATGATLMRDDVRALAAKAAGGPLRIAHPADMVADGTWIHWQERLFKKALRQPFKQVFRELYTLTAEEKASGPVSRRYDGHQVRSRQALALLGARGWAASRESGAASKEFRRHGYVARVALLPAIDGVCFTRPGEGKPVSLDSVPPVVFSETMRDIDLVVSVAHAGGVDPEATASTVEMRAALVRETARLLKLPNVGFSGSRVLIDGKLGEYSLHLGSGAVRRRPGGALRVLPAGSRHRGRLFLPFADDDPRTAEVISKVLLLARDHEIKDPTILEQLA